MNIFFYAPQDTSEAAEVWRWLKDIRPSLALQNLPSGHGLSSPESLNLRNGDLLIIYIRCLEELATLAEQGFDSSNYKICFIFSDNDPQLIKAGLLLNPKHCSSLADKHIHTEETIRKILKQNQMHQVNSSSN